MFGSRTGLGIGVTGLALVALLGLAGPAGAHSLPQSSSPSAGATLSTPPTKVTVTFVERPDSKLSSNNVFDSTGAAGRAGPTVAWRADARMLEVALAPGPGGCPPGAR